MKAVLRIDDADIEVSIDEGGVRVDGSPVASDLTLGLDIRMLDARTAMVAGQRVDFEIRSLAGVPGAGAGAGAYGPILSPMSGRIDSIDVTEGQAVSAGDVLFVLEAMKMRNQVKAAADGVITAIVGKPGAAVDARAHVVTLAPTVQGASAKA